MDTAWIGYLDLDDQITHLIITGEIIASMDERIILSDTKNQHLAI
jgi:hypothetical protein